MGLRTKRVIGVGMLVVPLVWLLSSLMYVGGGWLAVLALWGVVAWIALASYLVTV